MAVKHGTIIALAGKMILRMPKAKTKTKDHGRPPKSKGLHFKVSSFLKTIIGRDLITDDLVAVFELVKNSFDAHAKRVDLVFQPDKIYIIDDGKGMTLKDIIDKWLFVAYSAKKDGTEDENMPQDYREKLKASQKAYAGNKGVGRFSCDRLGGLLQLQTRSIKRGSKVEKIKVDWNRFDVDAHTEFRKITVNHSSDKKFDLGESLISPPAHGTVIEISNLGSEWDDSKLLKLKSSLAKLINPLGTRDDIKIWIHAPKYLESDIKLGYDQETGEISETIKKDSPDSYPKIALKIVNGVVKNPVFDLLNIKTTNIKVNLSNDGKYIVSELSDRGDLIYKIREKNTYQNLLDARVSVDLFFLNQAAKANFTRRMGIHQVSFGHVFLFNNGFRVYPVGEPDNDQFGLNKRKAQGYARYLGTREVLGRIDVWGSSRQFRESSSRDAGLVRTPAYLDLENLFLEKVIKRLEAYVADIIWLDKEDSDRETNEILKSREDSRALVIELLSKLANSKNIELLEYNPSFLEVLHERSRYFSGALEGIKAVAEKSGDKALLKKVAQAEKRFNELRKAEAEAQERVEKERKAREQAEADAKKARESAEAAEKEKRKLEKDLKEEQKRTIFLRTVSNVDQDNLLNLHHQIKTYSYTIENHLATMQRKLDLGKQVSNQDIQQLLDRVSFTNRKIKVVAELATRANFRLKTEDIEEDIGSFIEQYTNTIGETVYGDRIKLTVNNQSQDFIMTFKPIEVSMMIDNLLDNARKAAASEVSIDVKNPNKKVFSVKISDNGMGFDKSITDLDRIFEKGFTTTRGSGLGLFHVSEVVRGLGGRITAHPGENDAGAVFEITIKK